MDFFYLPVTQSKAWSDSFKFHENFFIDQGGFLWGLIGALIIGAVLACVFYFGCCNSKTSAKSATIGVWTLFLVLSGVGGYFYADVVFIGDSNKQSMFYEYSFYKANDKYFNDKAQEFRKSQSEIDRLTQTRAKIVSDLDKNGDVRVEYNATTAAWALVFFFLTSVGVKRFTRIGKHIPFLKP